jgi:hypothetical protein
MIRVEGTTTEFICEKKEVVTIDITEKNTTFLCSLSPTNADISMTGKTVTININSVTKTITLGFDFNSTGGFYALSIKGSKGGVFTRRVMQPSDNLPEVRTYVFHVQ